MAATGDLVKEESYTFIELIQSEVNLKFMVIKDFYSKLKQG